MRAFAVQGGSAAVREGPPLHRRARKVRRRRGLQRRRGREGLLVRGYGSLSSITVAWIL